MLKNEEGLITIDFIFALSLSLVFVVLLLAVSVTLSVVEITQYITFSAARNYFAGHISIDKQREWAQIKYGELTKQTPLQVFYQGGWFEIPKDITNDGIGNFGEDYEEDSLHRAAPFTGVRISLTAKMLSFNSPLFGSTGEEDSFQTYVGSYLSREPTSSECQGLIRKRFEAIKELFPSVPGLEDKKYIPIWDNGC